MGATGPLDPTPVCCAAVAPRSDRIEAGRHHPHDPIFAMEAALECAELRPAASRASKGAGNW